MMKKFLLFLALGFSFASVSVVYSQVSDVSVDLKKDEVLDILLLSQNPDAEDDLQSYFKTAFPIAKKMSYKPLPGFRILSHTEGNIRPSSLVLGKWKDVETREVFLNQIEMEVPDFHKRRRDIWSYFGLTYYEMKKDFTMKIDRDKFHIATAFWVSEEDTVSAYYKKWFKTMKRQGGNVVIELSDGVSPFGYQYAPTHFVIHAWDSENDYERFKEKMGNEPMDHLQHINEFIVQ